jgi:hypothetical protein
LGEAEVVVGGDVEGPSAGAGGEERLVVVRAGTVEDHDGTAGDAGDGLGETVVDPGFEPPGVEGIKVRGEGGVTLS